MKIVQSTVELEVYGDLQKIERCGRVCYRSEDKITRTSAEDFVRKLIKRGHESVLEHVTATAYMTVDRAIAGELRTHRLTSPSHESTRYVNYNESGMRVIIPSQLDDTENLATWVSHCLISEKNYNKLIKQGAAPQDARSVLPQCLATDVVYTANLREWRHILKLRTSTQAHPDMRILACTLLHLFKQQLPVVFEDINPILPKPPTYPEIIDHLNNFISITHQLSNPLS